MKIVSIITLILALFVASVAMTAISLLASLDAPSEDIRLEDIVAGRLEPMLLGPTLWGQYPSIPPARTLVGILALCMAGPPIVAAAYLLGVGRRWSLGVVSLAVLPLGIVPYALGKLILQAGNLPPDTCSRWVAVMLLGVLYASCASALFAGLEVVGMGEQIHRWFARRASSRRLDTLIVPPSGVKGTAPSPSAEILKL